MNKELFTGIVLTVFVLYFNILKPLLKAKLNPDLIEDIKYFTGVAILVVEKIFTQPKKGALKKAKVMEIVLDKFNIDEKELSTLIEIIIREKKKAGEM